MESSSPSWGTLDEFIVGTGREYDDTDSDRWVTYNLHDLYPDWQSRAACAGIGNASYFGDEETQPTMSIKQVKDAGKRCNICPVYTECLNHALTQREEYGVWAGTSGRVRRKIFSLLDNDLVTVPDVIERFLNGQGDFFKTFPATSVIEGAPEREDPEVGYGDLRLNVG